MSGRLSPVTSPGAMIRVRVFPPVKIFVSVQEPSVRALLSTKCSQYTSPVELTR